jgi:ADP-ribosylglycohydrolase
METEPIEIGPAPNDRFLGCLLGLGIGEALGLAGAGLEPGEIAARYGNVDSYLPRLNPDGSEAVAAGQVGSSTELALCLVESMLPTNGFVDPRTAGYRFVQLLDGEHAHLLDTTTRTALERARESWEYQDGVGGEGTAGAGPAARIAPVGLVHGLGRLNVEVLVREVLRATLITHASPESVNGALAIAWAIQLLVRGETPPVMLVSEVLSFIDEDETARQLRAAERMLLARQGDEEDAVALARIGTSGVVSDAVPAALYIASVWGADFRGAVTAAAAAGGASDAIGAMVGALCGAWIGAAALPDDLVDGLESRMYILMAAPALYRVAQRRAGLFLQLHQR